jgi:hypothetical protein
MRGAVYKRGSTWTWHFDIDPDPLTGRRRQRTKGGYQTKKAAEQALAEAIGQWRAGRLPQRSTHTLSHFLRGCPARRGTSAAVQDDQAASSLVGVTAAVVWSSAARRAGRYR